RTQRLNSLGARKLCSDPYIQFGGQRKTHDDHEKEKYVWAPIKDVISSVSTPMNQWTSSVHDCRHRFLVCPWHAYHKGACIVACPVDRREFQGQVRSLSRQEFKSVVTFI